MKETIFNVTIACDLCLRRKDPGQPKLQRKGLVSEYPLQKVYIDLTGPLSVTKAGKKYLLAAVDGFSKWSALIPLKSGSTEVIGNALLKE